MVLFSTLPHCTGQWAVDILQYTALKVAVGSGHPSLHRRAAGGVGLLVGCVWVVVQVVVLVGGGGGAVLDVLILGTPPQLSVKTCGGGGGAARNPLLSHAYLKGVSGGMGV